MSEDQKPERSQTRANETDSEAHISIPAAVPSSPSKVEKGLQAIALFEAAKALLILATGFGLFALIHKDVESVAAQIVRHLHLNPASKYPQIFIRAVQNLTDSRLWFLASMAMADAVLRSFEAYGLWKNRAWGKWLGVLSGMIYLPFEVYEIHRHATALKAVAFVLNIAIVIYLAAVLRNGSRPAAN